MTPFSTLQFGIAIICIYFTLLCKTLLLNFVKLKLKQNNDSQLKVSCMRRETSDIIMFVFFGYISFL